MAVKHVRSMWQPEQGMERPARVWSLNGQTVVGLLFMLALLAFEIFNFDTTRYALNDFLGDAGFAGLRWATVLAVAFCAIDFAGLVRFFMPHDEEGQMPSEVWYLMGAWLLGATMNALMTWWAVNLALLNHEFGNEVLSRQQLLEVAPIFVATLVWVTRILFIGAFSVAGGFLLRPDAVAQQTAASQHLAGLQRAAGKQQLTLRRQPRSSRGIQPALENTFIPVTDDLPPFLQPEMVAEEAQFEMLAPAMAAGEFRPRRRRVHTMQER